MQLLTKARQMFSSREIDRDFKSTSLISPQQFFGIEQNPFGVELAKVTLMIAKKLAIDEALEIRREQQLEMLSLTEDDALPLENLDSNLVCGDALFTEWPSADVVIGNPPFQSKNKMQSEFGREYITRLRKEYPDVPGRADYCVYWFRKAHDFVPEGHRAGLVATNTIRQNYSREASLDYIVGHGGTITEAVSSQVWSGDAVVHVSIVNWIKGKSTGTKRLMIQDGDSVDSPWRMIQTNKINSALSFDLDVTAATFGILQSDIHWLWFINRCSTFKADPRYTSNTVFDSYPWPQSPSSSCIRKIAEASQKLRLERRRIIQSTHSSLRELYKTLELPGRDALKDLSSALNSAVRNAYGISDGDSPLEFLLELNKELHERESENKRICGPGLPKNFKDAESLVSKDCISPIELS